MSPRPPDAAGSQNNLTAPPPGGGSGGPSPVPPSPGESPCRRPSPPDAVRRFESRQPAAPLPVRRCPPPGCGFPAAGRQAAPALLASAGDHPAAASRHRLASLPSPPNSRGGGASRLGAAGASLSQGVAPGHRRQGCSHLRPSAPRPQPLPVTGAPAAGHRAGGGGFCAGEGGDGLCRGVPARMLTSVGIETRQNTLSVATTV